MTLRTVLLLVGLFSCWSAPALAQIVDTSATGTLTEQTSSVTQQVTTATQQLEPVTNQVSPTADSTTSSGTGSVTSSGTGSAPDDSGRGSDAAERCESTAGSGASGGGPILTSAGGGTRQALVAARRERESKAGGAGVLGSVTEGTDPMPAPVPNAPNELPFWGGIAVLVLVGLGLAGVMAALTTQVLRRTRSG